MTDVTLLTCQAYFKPDKITPYIQNILFEEQLLKSALEKQGLTVEITYWDNSSYEAIINNDNIDFAELAEEVMGSKDITNE